MNNLYNKIYEAIDTGIQKALIIDDSQSLDISVNFHKKEITSDINLMNSYAYNILNNIDILYNYEQALNYYYTNNKKFKIDDYDGLVNLYNIIKKEINDTVDLKWVDMSNVISIVTYNGIKITLDEIRPNERATNFWDCFLKITSKKLKENNSEIFISLDHKHKNYVIRNKQWQTEEVFIQDPSCSFLIPNKVSIKDSESKLKNDMNGYENSLRIYNIVKTGKGYFDESIYSVPAIEYCLSLYVGNYQYQGYLPTITLLRMVLNCYKILIDSYPIFDEKLLYFGNKEEFTSSNEFDCSHIYGITEKGCGLGNKLDTGYTILPLFKKI